MADTNPGTTVLQAPHRARTDLVTYEFAGAPVLELLDQFRQFVSEVYAPGSLRLMETFHGSVSNLHGEEARILATVWESSEQDW